jgi:ABC-2 type transport system ATP-binding protein
MPEKAIVISTHILEEVDAVCTRAVIIADGRIVADGTPVTLAARSRHHNAVRIALARDARDAAVALKRLPDVLEIEEVDDGEGPALMVFARDGASIIAAVAAAAHIGGWPVAAMRVERGRLDDVFRAITLPPQ